MKKTIYLVRHAESEGNLSEKGNVDESPLSENGRAQAGFLAKRCTNLSLDAIITSPLERAKETGEIIASSIGLRSGSSDLLSERRKPSATFGQAIESEEGQKIWRAVWDNFHVPGFRHSDEENLEDLKERAKKALEHLAGRPEKTILVVTHGIFLRVLASYVLLGEGLTGRECVRFMSRLGTDNTGLSVLQYDSEDKFGRTWMISSWNDIAHLG
ncbi:MAG: histidine phosphatase family protein [Patescibacteria group bacterium]|nr:histidine phosphatase family protein [Patescibacteria group bacterium]